MKTINLAIILIGFFIQIVLGVIVGGYSDADKNSEDVKNAASFGVAKINELSNDAYGYKLVTIVKAETQVVAGTNYRLDIIIGPTKCLKKELTNDCPLNEKRHKHDCNITVYSRPWEDVTQLTSIICKPL